MTKRMWVRKKIALWLFRMARITLGEQAYCVFLQKLFSRIITLDPDFLSRDFNQPSEAE